MRHLDCLPCSGGVLQHNGHTLHWLVQSQAAHPALSLGRPPFGLLHPAEETRLAALTNPQRRRSWLLGRWTAKHLLQSVLQHTVGVRLPLTQLVIHNDRTGAPYAQIDVTLSEAKSLTSPGEILRSAAQKLHTRMTSTVTLSEAKSLSSPGEILRSAQDDNREFLPACLPLAVSATQDDCITFLPASIPQAVWMSQDDSRKSSLQFAKDVVRLPISLSISHAGPYAFCAVGPYPFGPTTNRDSGKSSTKDQPPLSVGADIEHIEPRGPTFAADFLSPQEMAHLRATQTDRRDTLMTALWSAKEATLKAMGPGLTVDPRRLICHLDWSEPAPLDGWRPFTLTAPTLPHTPVAGWWRTFNEYMLTLSISYPS